MTDEREVLATTPDGSVRVARAALGELDDLLLIQRAAFARVARQFNAPLDSMPPAHESLGELVKLEELGVCFLVALEQDGTVVGTVRGELVDETVNVGRLAVAESQLRRGVATALMLGLEAAFPKAERFDLFTGAEASGPIRLYERLGYHTYATERMGSWTMVRMAKKGSGPLP